MKRDFIDFHAVEPAHMSIHLRLENWARWTYSSTGQDVAPGFALYKSSDARREYGMPAPNVVDSADALKIAKAIAEIPVKNSAALNWSYITRTGPKRMCRHLDVDMAGLHELVFDARQRLIDSGV